MITIQDLNITLTKSGRKLVENFSLSLGEWDKAVLISEEGNGKSTFLKLLYDPSLVESYCEFSGNFSNRREKPGYLAQEASEELLDTPVCDIFRGADMDEITGLMYSLGIYPEMLTSERILRSFSGGEKLKLRLLRMMADRPTFLLLDEPSNDLDIESLEIMEDFINSAEMPVLFASHDETLIENTANVIVHFEQLRKKSVPRHTVSRMPYREYAELRLSSIMHQEQVARKEREDHAARMERWQRIYNRVDHEQRVISRAAPSGGRLLKKKMHSVKAQEKRFEKMEENFTEFPDVEEAILFRFDENISVPAGKNVLDIEIPELYAGERLLAENIRLNVKGGEHIGIIGANGAGKTTLLRKINDVLSERRDIRVGYVPQDYNDLLDPGITAGEFLAPDGDKESLTRAYTFLGSLRFTHEEMTREMALLSGGQRAKLAMVRLILNGCDVLLLDEPTRNFSPLSTPVLRQVLNDFGGSIISVSHDRKYLSEVCTKIYRLTPAGLLSD